MPGMTIRDDSELLNNVLAGFAVLSGIAIAAVCVWLAVGLINRRSIAGWKFWMAAALFLVFVAYPLSVGPACWLRYRQASPEWASDVFYAAYAPIAWFDENGPRPLRHVFRHYAEFCASR